jgi:hypothetical protein
MESSISRKATQNASVGGWAALKLTARRADLSKRVMLFDTSAVVESGRVVATGWRTPSDLTEEYSLSFTFPCESLFRRNS